MLPGIRNSNPGVAVRTAVYSGRNWARKNATTAAAAANLFWWPVIGRTSCPTNQFFYRACPTLSRADFFAAQLRPPAGEPLFATSCCNTSIATWSTPSEPPHKKNFLEVYLGLMLWFLSRTNYNISKHPSTHCVHHRSYDHRKNNPKPHF